MIKKDINNVAFIARPDLLSNPGGDTTQILATKTELENLGVFVSLILADKDSLHQYFRALRSVDIVHCFNLSLSYQFEHLIRYSKSIGKPVVLSPIFWDMEQYEQQPTVIPQWKKFCLRIFSLIPANNTLTRFLTTHIKSTTYNPYYRKYLKYILQIVDVVLPNSEAERVVLLRLFDVKTRYRIVYNACRFSKYSVDASSSVSSPYILCVGRIERRKNQLNLIEAMKGIDATLVLLGNINLAEKKYWKQCLKLARKHNVSMLQIQGKNWDEVWPYYLNAIAHIQPSWFETPGLSSLEAGAAGCRIVCTKRGSAPEYFGDFAVYCDPSDPESIHKALLKTLQREHDGRRISNFVKETYTWTNAASKTFEAYQSVFHTPEKKWRQIVHEIAE